MSQMDLILGTLSKGSLTINYSALRSAKNGPSTIANGSDKKDEHVNCHHDASLPMPKRDSSLRKVILFLYNAAMTVGYYILVLFDNAKHLYFSSKAVSESKIQDDFHNIGCQPEPKWGKESFERVPVCTAVMTYLGFYLLMLLGQINQLLFSHQTPSETNREGYTPLYDRFEKFYLRYVCWRLKDCWFNPVSSIRASEVVVKRRVTYDNWRTFKFSGEERKCLNLSSFNYLGFAESTGKCAEDTIRNIREKNGLGLCSPRHDYGTTEVVKQLEALTAEFLGVEDAVVFGSGFASNALNIPSIISKGCLILSDEKNHASLILGFKLSGAETQVFYHNDMKHLEKLLREAIANGQPKTGAPWKKILIVAEGIFSMEGSIVHLPQLVALKKKYKAYLYLDEAHSIGAIGPTGRGVADYYGLNPRDVDILMGTFSKAFGSNGGFIAGSTELINNIRAYSHAATYGSSMSPPVAQCAVSAISVIMGRDGSMDGARRISQLANNTRYVRKRLNQMGVIVYGNEDSPTIPLLVYQYSKMGVMVRTLADKKIAAVGVIFPATPLMKVRLRFCLSAAHTKEQLEYAMDAVEELADQLGLKHSQKPRDPNPVLYDDLQ